VFDQPRDPVGERPRLAAARAGNHQQRPVAGGDGGVLLFVELSPVINVQIARTVRGMKNVFLTHFKTASATSTATLNTHINPAGMNFRVFTYRTPITINSAAVNPIATHHSCRRPPHNIAPVTISEMPNANPAVSDAVLCALR